MENKETNSFDFLSSQVESVDFSGYVEEPQKEAVEVVRHTVRGKRKTTGRQAKEAEGFSRLQMSRETAHAFTSLRLKCSAERGRLISVDEFMSELIASFSAQSR